jgi:ABC-type lipoprotein release transport system permease subunit
VALALGLPASVAAGRGLRGLLFEVSASDPWTLTGVSIVLGGAALIASYLPARRAARVDPMETLRCE